MNIDELINKSYLSEGSVEGVMEMVTVHENNYFRVYDAIQAGEYPVISVKRISMKSAMLLASA